jgi:hypothetical protein
VTDFVYTDMERYHGTIWLQARQIGMVRNQPNLAPEQHNHWSMCLCPGRWIARADGDPKATAVHFDGTRHKCPCHGSSGFVIVFDCVIALGAGVVRIEDNRTHSREEERM